MEIKKVYKIFVDIPTKDNFLSDTLIGIFDSEEKAQETCDLLLNYNKLQKSFYIVENIYFE